MDLQVHTPDSMHMIDLRDRLLQTSLRDQDCPFAIRDEYPIVLSPNNAEYSHVIINQGDVIAHLNIWPRHLIDGDLKEIATIGLIGNVATHPDWRGRGVMRQMFEWLDRERGHPEFDAMVLWSDLDKFYQNLGYRSQAKEFRALLDCTSCPATIKDKPKFLQKEDLNQKINPFLEHCLSIRPELPCTVQRDSETFRQLLRIPATMLFYLPERGAEALPHVLAKPRAYAILGKGYDMVGVIHEWGADNPEDLVTLIRGLGYRLQAEQLMVLLPEFCEQEFHAKVRQGALSIESHPMALVKSYKPNLDGKLDQMFIWGLDSI